MLTEDNIMFTCVELVVVMNDSPKEICLSMMKTDHG